MQLITGELPLKRKKIHIKWLRPTRPSPITGGKETTGILEDWNTGMMGSDEKRENFFDSSIFHDSTIPSIQNDFVMR